MIDKIFKNVHQNGHEVLVCVYVFFVYIENERFSSQGELDIAMCD